MSTISSFNLIKVRATVEPKSDSRKTKPSYTFWTEKTQKNQFARIFVFEELYLKKKMFLKTFCLSVVREWKSVQCDLDLDLPNAFASSM